MGAASELVLVTETLMAMVTDRGGGDEFCCRNGEVDG